MFKNRIMALLLSVMMVFCCAAALAEAPADDNICAYTVYNMTGETVVELYLVDNATGEKGENYAGEKGLANQSSVVINGENYEGYVKTLTFKTESGYEGSFETLHFETVPITLLAADALTGATPINFFLPEYEACYTLNNETGEKVTEISFTNNIDGTVFEFEGFEGIEAGDALQVIIPMEADKTGKEFFELTFRFVTESGYEGTFATLHFETVQINLLAADALTGATQISFSMPPAAE